MLIIRKRGTYTAKTLHQVAMLNIGEDSEATLYNSISYAHQTLKSLCGYHSLIFYGGSRCFSKCRRTT